MNDELFILQRNSIPGETDWVKSNIDSIKNTVSKGLHSTVYYPCSGIDALRVLLAYDAERIVCGDLRSSVKSLLDKAGYKYDLLKFDNFTVYELELNNKSREIIEYKGDVNNLDLSLFLDKKPDVYHVFLTNDNRINEYLTRDNYNKVGKGGFFCFNEKRIGEFFGGDLSHLLKDKWLELMGLKEHVITKRHPYDVMTSFYPSKKELKDISKIGYIYEKFDERPKEAIDALFNIQVRLGDFYMGFLNALNSAYFDILSNNENTSLTDIISKELMNYSSGINEDLSVLKNYFSLKDIKMFGDELKNKVINDLVIAQENYKKLFPKVNKVKNELLKGVKLINSCRNHGLVSNFNNKKIDSVAEELINNEYILEKAGEFSNIELSVFNRAFNLN